MAELSNTPFNEYREEQSDARLKDYFVKPHYFEQLKDNKNKFIYGSRGTGKTTLLKALAIEMAEDRKAYLENNKYIGIYFKIDLNKSNGFKNSDVSDEIPHESVEDVWYKLYSYYFTCSVAMEMLKQLNFVKEEMELDEENICRNISSLFNHDGAEFTFSAQMNGIRDEIRKIQKYINNSFYQKVPSVGVYADILRDIPQIVFENCKEAYRNKHFVYLIDEFESMGEYQQKAVLSLIKYANRQHSYIIGLRPLGLKVSTTIGNEPMREPDDYINIIIDEKKDFEKFAEKVCNKRVELFYREHMKGVKAPKIKELLGTNPVQDEVQLLFQDTQLKKKHADRVKKLFTAFNIQDKNTIQFFTDHPESYYLLEIKLVKDRNKRKAISKDLIIKEIEWLNGDSTSRKEFVGNYKTAIIYYVDLLYDRRKDYSGFKSLVNISGYTLRYVLEMCNEIFLRMQRDNEKYFYSPSLVPAKIQSEEVVQVSQRRFDQISTISGIGPTIRRFVNTFGLIAKEQHESSSISKIEPNHFSIKSSSSSDQEVECFLTECVLKGVFIRLENNKIKVKNTIGFDDIIYQLHPIYTPKFRISWRRKQKIEFSLSQINTMIQEDRDKTNKVMKYFSQNLVSNDVGKIIRFLKDIPEVVEQTRQEDMFDYFEPEIRS